MIKKRSKYPEFYEILITEAVASKLKLNPKIPFVEIQELKKNKSFVAKKAKTFNEEKTIHQKAPITNVKIEYKANILIVCFKTSVVLNDKKFVRDFFKFSS